MTKPSLEYYLDRYTSGTITATEWQELRVLLNDPVQAELFNQLLDLQLAAADPAKDGLVFSAVTNRVVKAVEDSINQRIAITGSENEVSPPVRQLSRNRWWWAAASIFVLIMSAYWWLPSATQKQAGNLKEITPAGDALPGREGAILTLADGKQIVLDSTSAGLIATQRGSQVSLEQGLLRYETHAKETASDVIAAVHFNTMTTPRGRQFQLMLPDGTRVWLNAASSITYPTAFTAGQRQIQISGEAYFEVAKNEQQPFIVLLPDGGRVEVLGTHFNVNAYADEATVKTTLLEGSVKVVKGTAAVTLLPQQQAESKEQIIVHHHIDTDQVMAWKNGWFNAEGVDLKTVLRQMARWYDVEIVYASQISNEPFSGKIDRSIRLSQALSLLQNAGVQCRVDGNKLIVGKQ
jgi:transmembrane sensor